MSALDQIRSRVTVDVDQLDPDIAVRLGPFQDMTSNQALIAGVVCDESRVEFIKEVVVKAKQHAKGDDAVEVALDLCAVLLAKAVLPHIKGRVHAQLSPRHAHSIPSSLSHAHRLIALFESEGIPRSRVCLKIPSTGAGLVTASKLEEEGIRTLATTLFSVDQALAAVQAGCLYIAPYFNQLSVHFEPETWVEYEDTAREHPMAGVIREIVKVYKGIEGKKPLVMPASLVTPAEALAISTLGVDHITISGKILAALAADKDVQDFRAEGSGVTVSGSETEPRADGTGGQGPVTDFLADDGAALDASNSAEQSVKERLDYAIEAFAKCEQRIIETIRLHL